VESRVLDLLRAIEKTCIISRAITAPVEIMPTIRAQSGCSRGWPHTCTHLRSIMYRVCIALVDATRARLFTLDRVDDGAETHEELVERTDLVNPQRRRRPSELFSDTRPGSSRVGQLQYAFDDHRDHHISQLDEKFARAVMATLRELIDERPTQRVIVCASPRMLGKLRASAPGILPHDLTFDELPRDLVKLSPADVRAGLARQGVLPPSTTSSAQRTMK
jgi:protein required for attachment to host cells